MKKLWKILLGIGAVILGIFAMSAGRGSKKQFKKDLKDNKKKINEIKNVNQKKLKIKSRKRLLNKMKKLKILKRK